MTTLDLTPVVTDLLRDEGERLVVYDDANGLEIRPGYTVIGHPTIGVGRCLDLAGISPAESRMLLLNSLTECIDEMERLTWFKGLDPVRQRAVLNMRFQMGLDGLLSFHEMIAALTRHAWAAAYRAGLESRWASETPERAQRVMRMILTGFDDETNPAVAEQA